MSETNSMFLTLSRWNRVSKDVWCFLCIFLSMTVTPVGACSRVLYRGPDGAVVVGRSMDWGTVVRGNCGRWASARWKCWCSVAWWGQNMGVLPRLYDVLVADGMNEKGLWSMSSISPAVSIRSLMVLACSLNWSLAQYVLDTFATAML